MLMTFIRNSAKVDFRNRAEYNQSGLQELEMKQTEVILIMKRFMSILLAAAMALSFVLPVAAEEETSAYDIQVLTTKADCDEIYSYVDDDGLVNYNWYYGIRLDVVIEGKTYTGITPHEFELLVYETYPESNINISYGSVAQTQETPWVIGGTYACHLSLTGDGLWEEYPVDVTIVETTAESVEIEIMPYYAYMQWPDPVITVTFADGSKVSTESEFVSLRYSCEQWPTTPGTHTVSGMLGAVEMDANVTVGAMPVTIDTPVVVDELFGEEMEIYDEQTGEPTGETWKYYRWEEAGRLDATVNGTKYTGISFQRLCELITESYGQYSYSFYGDEAVCELLMHGPSAENQMEVGKAYTACIVMDCKIDGTQSFVLGQEISVVVSETQIASVSAEPVTYYAYEGSAWPEFVATYKDGTTEKLPEGISCQLVGQWPKEPGTYTLKFDIGGRFEASVQATVLPTPTSGDLGETVSWNFNSETETLTLSGTGEAVAADFSDDLTRLFMSLLPKHIVVEEGITKLPAGIFHYSPAVESLSLPTTLVELPTALFGWNGPSKEMAGTQDMDYTGMTSVTIPEGVKELTNASFYLCWGITDFYLPASLEKLDPHTITMINGLREACELEMLDTTIHFAGTPEQWAAIEHVAGADRENYGTGMSDEEIEALFASYTVVFGPEVEIPVEDGTATVPDEAVQVTEGETAVIDASKTGEAVDSVVIGADTVDRITDAQAGVEIKLTEAAVTLDAAALEAVSGKETVTIVAEKIEETQLNAVQQAALAEKSVCLVLKLEAYAGQTKVTDFGGGLAVVSVPYALPAGKEGVALHVAFVAEDGKLSMMPTTYADGMLTFMTPHFSHYAVMETVPGQKAATIGETGYDTLAAALAAAKAGETVKLQANAEAGQIVLSHGVCLDLNGWALVANYVVAFEGADLVDSVGTGILKCENVRLEADNAMMPIWVQRQGGYRLFGMRDSQLYSEQKDSSFMFIAKPVPGKSANGFLLTQANAGVTLKIRIRWQSASGNDVEQNFVLKNEDLKTVYSRSNGVAMLTVSGAAAYVNRLYTTAVMVSETGVEWVGQELLYTGK